MSKTDVRLRDMGRIVKIQNFQLTNYSRLNFLFFLFLLFFFSKFCEVLNRLRTSGDKLFRTTNGKLRIAQQGMQTE